MEGTGHGYKKGFWTAEEDRVLTDCVKKHGTGKWNRIAKVTGLKRCGKSCRLRWMNYLRPDVKRGDFSEEEKDLIIRLHKLLGNRWSLIAGRIPGRTDNQVKNYWNTHLSMKLSVKKEKTKVYVIPKTVPNEPEDNCNSASKCIRHSESIVEAEKLVQASSCGALNLASMCEGIMTDDSRSAFCFANSELSLCTSFFTESFQEYFMGF